MAGFRGHWRKMLASTRLNSLQSSLAMPTTTCGSPSSIFKLKRNNTLSSYAQPTPLTKKPIAFPMASPLSASHRPPGPPSHPPERFGHILVLAHQPLPHHLTQLAPLTHIRTNQNLGDPLPLTSGTTKHYRVTLAVYPLVRAPPQGGQARHPNAPGKHGG